MKLSRSYAEELGLNKISLSPIEGRLITTLVASRNCKKFVEIGTLTGLSALYILEGLTSGGTLWTLEKSENHAEKARDVFAQYHSIEMSQLEGLSERTPKQMDAKNIELILGDAEITLKTIASQGPFDGIFIDGNKAAYGKYLQWADTHIRPGGLILADNVFLFGSLWGDNETIKVSEKQVRVMEEFNKILADSTKYISTLIPTEEGLFFAIKRETY